MCIKWWINPGLLLFIFQKKTPEKNQESELVKIVFILCWLVQQTLTGNANIYQTWHLCTVYYVEFINSDSDSDLLWFVNLCYRLTDKQSVTVSFQSVSGSVSHFSIDQSLNDIVTLNHEKLLLLWQLEGTHNIIDLQCGISLHERTNQSSIHC